MNRSDILFRTSNSFFGFLLGLALNNVHRQGWLTTHPKLYFDPINVPGCLAFMAIGTIIFLFYWDNDTIKIFRDKTLEKTHFLFFIIIALLDYIVACAPYLGYVFYLHLATFLRLIG